MLLAYRHIGFRFLQVEEVLRGKERIFALEAEFSIGKAQNEFPFGLAWRWVVDTPVEATVKRLPTLFISFKMVSNTMLRIRCSAVQEKLTFGERDYRQQSAEGVKAAQAQTFQRFVEVGRVVLLEQGPNAGKLATIVEIQDASRVRAITRQLQGQQD